ncbi:MAG: 30S ribosomal protein S9 [Candidatus Marinamargulisbacteria bacterium]
MSTDKKKKDQKKSTASASKPKATVKKKVVVKKKAPVKKVASEVPVSISKKKSEKVVVKAKPTPMKVHEDALYATGRRKESTAKVWLFKGSGKVKINHLDPLLYLSSERLVNKVLLPLNLLNLSDKYDVRIDVIGGGLTGQAEASTLGVARAVLSISEDFKSELRQNGLLTQDRREKERKKYGKRGARKSPQFRKR